MIAVKAGLLKSINQYFNKELARLRSINDLQGNERKQTKKIQKLFMKGDRKVNDIRHVIIHEECHTSKCSFLDNEGIEHHDNYAGKRIKRGLFRSSNGTLIHADLNASYNIIKKAIPEAFANGIEGIGLFPRSLSIGQMITSKGGC